MSRYRQILTKINVINQIFSHKLPLKLKIDAYLPLQIIIHVSFFAYCLADRLDCVQVKNENFVILSILYLWTNVAQALCKETNCASALSLNMTTLNNLLV